MPSTTIVTRAGKGSALSHNEMDTNWNNLLNATLYVGSILMWPTSTSPDSKWLLCEGQSLSTASYPDLFTLIGYNYGGSGASFNLPDFRGRFARGWDHGAGIDPDASTRTDRGDGTAGDSVGTKQADELKAHDHWGQGVFAAGGGAAPTGFDAGASGGNQSVAFVQGVGLETRPKNISMAFLIKALK